MTKINFIADEEWNEISIKKCNQIIDILSDVEDLRLKAFILHNLVLSFKDISGIDIFKFVRIEEKENEN